MADALLEQDGPVAWVTMNRPAARNGMNAEMLDRMTRILQGVANDSDVRVVVLRGAGTDFSVGADLRGLSGQDAGDDRGDQELADVFELPVLLHKMPQITLAAVRGACAGAAFALACACDLRVCDDTGLFRTAFAAVGVAGDMSGAWTLPRLVGSGQARALFLLNERIGPDRALAMGLVSHVIPGPTFGEEVAAMAARIAGWPPLGLRAMKANFLDAETESLAAYTRLESARHLELLATADVKEAALAFLEKRPPRFQGR
jgi:2-(1,2-epoxy-1,2-dihydrophenyl)acetyl-CoA isomerase